MQTTWHPNAHDLHAMVQTMVGMGPRLTGSPAHKAFIDYLEVEMSALGLHVIRDAYTFERWQARSYSLAVDDGRGGETPIGLAGYFPYSGNTPAVGIERDLVSLDLPMENTTLFRDLATFVGHTLKGKWKEALEAAWHATRGDVEDKIVLVYGPIAPVTTGVFLPLLSYAKDSDLDGLESSDFKRAWLGSLLFGIVLDFLSECGAAGAIFHLDASPENAKGQYLPFSSPRRTMPAVLVDREIAKELRDRASGSHPSKARLTLVADIFPDTRSDSLVAILPGASYKSKRDKCMIVNTHTDGQNAIEENGAVACIAIARHYATIPQSQRPRTLVFSLVTGHMGPNLPQTQGFVDRFPELVAKATCGMTIEHLGATEWLDDALGYHATGQPEFAAAFHSETQIGQIAKQCYKASPLTHVNLLRPIFDTPISRITNRNPLARLLRRAFDTRLLPAFFGVGAALHQAGVPSIGYLTGPNYLVTISDDGEMSKFDPQRMRLETEWIVDTLHRLERVPAWKLTLGPFRHHLGIVLSAISLLLVGIYSAKIAMKLAGVDTAYLVGFLCLTLIIAIPICVYALVRAVAWLVLDFATVHFWRQRISRRLRREGRGSHGARGA